MLLSGEKTEEYRELKPYWQSRLCNSYLKVANGCKHINCDACQWNNFKKFDIIHFYNGGSPSLKYPNFQIEFKGIKVDYGIEKWGAEPNKKYFILKLGKIIKT